MLSTLPQSNSQRSNAHCSMLSATCSSQLRCSSLSSFTSLPLSSSLGLNILLNAFPLSSSSTPPLSSSLTVISSLSLYSKKPSRSLTLHVCSSSFPRCIFNGFLRVFFTLSLFLSAILLSLSFLFLPFASPSFFPNVVHALAVAPALSAPARVDRAMASDFHANLNVAAGVVTGTLTACGSMPLAVWGALPKRRGNAGSDSELPYYLNTFLEARWGLRLCVHSLTPTLSLSLSHSHSHSHSHLALTLTHFTLSLSVQLVRVFLRTRARAFRALLPLSRSLTFFSLLFFVIVFACSSSLSYLLPLCTSFLFFFTSASSSCCFFLSCRLLLLCFRLS